MGALPEEDQSSRVMLLSADCHAGPRVKQFREFLDPEFRQAFDEYAAAVSVLEEAPLHTSDDLAEATRGQLRLERDHVAGLADPSARVSDLDADGIAAEIIFPQGSVPFHRYPPQAQAPARSVTNHFDPRLRRAGVRAYNRWLAEFCAANTGRHLGIAVVPIDDVAAAVQEVEWARDAGLRSVSLPPISDAYPHYNDACYEPFWEACAVLNMPLQAHGASTVWYGTGPDHYALTLAECDFFTRRSLWFLIFSGVFDRHPDLNLVFTEQRAGWVVQTLADMDSIYEFQPSGLQQILAQRPSWYFAGNCYIGGSFLSRAECAQRDRIGVDRIMWGSDYPHMEGTWPATMDSLRMTFEGVPEDEMRAMVGWNAAELYGVDRDSLQQVADRIGPSAAEISKPLGDDFSPSAIGFTWAFRQSGTWA